MEFEGQEKPVEISQLNFPNKVTAWEKFEEEIFYIISISPVFVTFGLYIYFLIYYVGVSFLTFVQFLTFICSFICIQL